MTRLDNRFKSPSAEAGPHPLRAGVRGIERTGALDTPGRWLDLAIRPLEKSSIEHLLRGRWLGHALHPLLTDLPLGMWASAGVLDLVGGAAARPARQRLVGLGVAAAVPTALTGASEFGTLVDRSTRRVGVVHGVGNLTVMALYTISWLRRRAGRHTSGTAWGLLGGLAAIGTGYLGGHLSFGRGGGQGERWSDDLPGDSRRDASGDGRGRP